MEPHPVDATYVDMALRVESPVSCSSLAVYIADRTRHVVCTRPLPRGSGRLKQCLKAIRFCLVHYMSRVFMSPIRESQPDKPAARAFAVKSLKTPWHLSNYQRTFVSKNNRSYQNFPIVYWVSLDGKVIVNPISWRANMTEEHS